MNEEKARSIQGISSQIFFDIEPRRNKSTTGLYLSDPYCCKLIDRVVKIPMKDKPKFMAEPTIVHPSPNLESNHIEAKFEFFDWGIDTLFKMGDTPQHPRYEMKGINEYHWRQHVRIEHEEEEEYTFPIKETDEESK